MTLPTYPWRFAHLAALWAFGVSQPVFSMLQANPEFLVINGATRTEAVAFAVVVTLLPPLVAIACEVALGFLSKGASAVAHILFVWAFGFTALLQLLSLLDPGSRWSIALPAVAAYLGAMAYARWRPLRSFLSERPCRRDHANVRPGSSHALRRARARDNVPRRSQRPTAVPRRLGGRRAGARETPGHGGRGSIRALCG